MPCEGWRIVAETSVPGDAHIPSTRHRSSRAVTELLASDLDEIIAAAESDLRDLAGTRFYVTGGTGFIGTWLLRAIAHANARLGTGIRLDALTRRPDHFERANPDIVASADFRLLRGDVCAPAVDGTYDVVVHGAATSGTTFSPGEAMRTIVDGTRAVIRDVVAKAGSIPVLFLSSGAVYGRTPAAPATMAEDYCGALDHCDPRFTYHESKRLAELCFAIAERELTANCKIARLFAFLGPGLPLDAHFAAGNFVADTLKGGPIRVNSAGHAVRTYMYPTDLIAWCLAVLNRGGRSRAYNVGSDEAVTIGGLAQRIAALATSHPQVSVAGDAPGAIESRYVPDVARICEELGVRRSVDLDEAILRTLHFHERSIG